MYRLLGNYPGQPRNGRRPARASAQRAALKMGDRPGEPVEGTVEKPPTEICWEASDQHGNAKGCTLGGCGLLCNRAKVERRYCAGTRVFAVWLLPRRRLTCARHAQAVVSELPKRRLMRTTRIGQSELATKQGNLSPA